MSVYFLSSFSPSSSFQNVSMNEKAKHHINRDNMSTFDENNLIISLLKKENGKENIEDRTGWVKISPYLDKLESDIDIKSKIDKKEIDVVDKSIVQIKKESQRVERNTINKSENDTTEKKLSILDASCKRLRTLTLDILQVEEKVKEKIPIELQNYVYIDYSVNRIQNKSISKIRNNHESSQDMKEEDSLCSMGSQMEKLSFLPHLYILDLSYNLLESFEFFCPLPTLQILLLKSNQIKSMENLNTLFPALRYLDLSYNNLETLSISSTTDTFSISSQEMQCHKYLRVIKLNGNQIQNKYSNEDYLSNFIRFVSNIRDLDLSDNLIQNINFLSSLKKVEFVNITQNRIEDLEEMCNVLKDIKTLKVLKCKDNPFLKPSSFSRKNQEGKIQEEQKLSEDISELRRYQQEDSHMDTDSSNFLFDLAHRLSALPHLERVDQLEISEPLLEFMAEAQYKKDINDLIERITSVYNIRLEKEKENNDQIQQQLKKNGKEYMDHYLETRRKLEKELDGCVRYVQCIDLQNKAMIKNIQDQIKMDLQEVEKMKYKTTSALNSFQGSLNSISEGPFGNGANFSNNDKFQLCQMLHNYSKNASTTINQCTEPSSPAREDLNIDHSKNKNDLKEGANNNSSKTEQGYINEKSRMSKVAKIKNFLFF